MVRHGRWEDTAITAGGQRLPNGIPTSWPTRREIDVWSSDALDQVQSLEDTNASGFGLCSVGNQRRNDDGNSGTE